MTKILLLSAHPRLADSQFSRCFLNALGGDVFDVKILADLHPDGRFDAAREQADLRAARAIVFLFPFHWYAPPALLQKWFADVLVDTDQGDARSMLKDKRVHAVVSTGGTRQAYSNDGQNGFTVEQFLRSFTATIGYAGGAPQSPMVHYAVWQLTNDDIAAIAHRLEQEMGDDQP